MAAKHSPTCVVCGYALTGLSPAATCPECGATDAGVLVETPLTIRVWAGLVLRYTKAPRASLERPVVRGRADAWISFINVVVGSILILSPLVTSLYAESFSFDWYVAFIAWIFDIAGTGLLAAALLASLQRAVAALALRSMRISRSRTRAILAASSGSVVLVGAATTVLSAPLVGWAISQGGAASAGAGPVAWSAAVAGIALLTAVGLLIVATLSSCRAARPKRPRRQDN